jgi:glycerol-3-phosphate dehydrogenase
VEAFIAEANEAFPALALTRSQVKLVHRGLVPAIVGRNGAVDLKPASEILDHAADVAEGAMTVVGVKYTTARATAEQTTRAVARRLGARVRPSRTATTTLPGGGMADHEALAIEAARAAGVQVAPETVQHLASIYAEKAAVIVRVIAEHPELAAPVASGVPTIGAEVVQAIHHEMACRLGDIVIRRTGLGAARHPGAVAVAECARIAAAELGWDAARTADEIAAVDRFYEIRA